MEERIMQSGSYLKVTDAAEIVGRSREWGYDLVQRGDVAGAVLHVAGRGLKPVQVIDLASFNAYIEQHYANLPPLPRANAVRAAKAKAKAAAATVQVLDISDLRAQQAEAVRRYRSGERVTKIAAAMHLSYPTVRAHLTSAGLEIRQPGWPQMAPESPEGQRIVNLYRAGNTPLQIARLLGLPRSSSGKIIRLLDSAGVRRRGRSEAATLRWRQRGGTAVLDEDEEE